MNFFNSLLGEMDSVLEPLKSAMKIVMPILFTVVGLIGAIRCVMLGLAMANAADGTQREEAKKKLWHAILGYGIMFVLVAALWIINPLLIDWVDQYQQS